MTAVWKNSNSSCPPLLCPYSSSFLIIHCSLHPWNSPTLFPETPPQTLLPACLVLWAAPAPWSLPVSCLPSSSASPGFQPLPLLPGPALLRPHAWQDMVLVMAKNRSCIKERWDPNKVWSRKYNDPPNIWFWCFHRSCVSASKHVNYLYFAFKLSFAARFPS